VGGDLMYIALPIAPANVLENGKLHDR